MNQTKLSEYLSSFYIVLVKLWYSYSKESKVYFLIFFFFCATIASILYKVSIDVYAVDEERNHSYFRLLRTDLSKTEEIRSAPAIAPADNTGDSSRYR
jgi:hypothetical protein